MSERTTGEETRNALADVLEDQAARRKRRDEAATEPKDRGRLANLLAGPIALLTLWFVVSPPAILRPPPVPAPSMEEIRNGLHMDIYLVAAQVFAYRQSNGRLPGTLAEALLEAGSATDLAYLVTGADAFEISGMRAGQAVTYRSSQPLRQFVAEARAAVRAENGS